MPTLKTICNARELEQFVSELRSAVDGYLQSVDAWENTYQKQYRLLDPPRLSADLEPFQQDYIAARHRLERLVPQRRQLSRRHELPDPWAGLLHIRLGATTPQMGAPLCYRAMRTDRPLPLPVQSGNTFANPGPPGAYPSAYAPACPCPTWISGPHFRFLFLRTL
jgi:hypothetical protein